MHLKLASPLLAGGGGPRKRWKGLVRIEMNHKCCKPSRRFSPLVPAAPPFPRSSVGQIKGRRLYGQARRQLWLTVHILCRMCTVSSTVECHYGAPPRTPYGPSRGNEMWSWGFLSHTLLVPFQWPPLVAGATTFPPLCCGTMGAGQGCQFACGAATERNRTTGPVARWKCTPFGANAPPFPRWGNSSLRFPLC